MTKYYKRENLKFNFNDPKLYIPKTAAYKLSGFFFTK